MRTRLNPLDTPDAATLRSRTAPIRATGILRPFLQPATHRLRRLMGAAPDDIRIKAVEQWDVAPASIVTIRPAKVLPGQLDRIRGAEFGPIEQVLRDLRGGFDSVQRPTTAFRLTNVLLLDGVLYAGGTARHLKPRSGRLPVGFARQETQASLYESWVGNRWFGNWLSDDCLTYRLAEQAGCPITTASSIGHQPAYERGLGMKPRRMTSGRFDELILFDDLSHNEGKRDRATDLRRRMVGSEPARHPGVFLLRGSTGARRVLRNERVIAEHLAKRRNFRIIDPSMADLDDIIRACAGAQVVAGVEGSHLVHGLMLMPAAARALVIQPPNRTVSVLKLLTDRQEQEYSLVVGVGNDEVFDASVGEIERTLDLA